MQQLHADDIRVILRSVGQGVEGRHIVLITDMLS